MRSASPCGLLTAALLAACAPQQPTMVYEDEGTFRVGTLAQIAASEQQQRDGAEQRQRDMAAQSAAIQANNRREQRRIDEADARQDREDDAAGYRRMDFTDFQLDFKTMPLGTKVSISGIYKATRQLETLSESFMPDAAEVVLITDGAPREVRKQLIACRGPAPCLLTILAHVSSCRVTWFGANSDPVACLVVAGARAVSARTG
jgi:hypothetical protein